MVGLGTMGAGIAQLCVQAGMPTVAFETTPELAERGRAASRAARARGQEGDDHAERRDETLALLGPATDVEALEGCDLVIEAVFESLEVKHELFPGRAVGSRGDRARDEHLGAVGDRDRRASRAPRARRRHALLQPGAVLPLVEVVRADATADGGLRDRVRVRERLGKQPIACVDTPGFVVNRILIPVLNDAVRVSTRGSPRRRTSTRGCGSAPTGRSGRSR